LVSWLALVSALLAAMLAVSRKSRQWRDFKMAIDVIISFTFKVGFGVGFFDGACAR
jgi:hypothetical protein